METCKVLVLNGYLGVGKTRCGLKLVDLISRSAFLDGDYLAAVNPFSIQDDVQFDNLMNLLKICYDFRLKQGYTTFILAYVIDSLERKKALEKIFENSGVTLEWFYLYADHEVLKKRLHKRGVNDLIWEVNRNRQLEADVLDIRSQLGFEIDTSNLTMEETVEIVLKRIFS